MLSRIKVTNKINFRAIRIGGANVLAGIFCLVVLWIIPFDMLRIAIQEGKEYVTWFWAGVFTVSFPFGILITIIILVNWGYWNEN